MELTRSQKFIRDNKRVLGCGMDYYNPDTSYMSFEDWDKKRLHFLLIFPTPSAVKAVSSTAAAILDYTITHCPDVYIDFAYVPDATDMKLYDKNDMPYAIGLNSHLDASHFELVGFSISVLCEVIGMATIMNSFSRCDKPIPLTWTERKDAILGTYPVIYCGGITAACGDIMYGPLGDGRQAFPDFTYLGDCCKLNVISNRFLQAIDNGEVIRTKEDREYNGSKHYPEKFEATLTEKFKVITHQDFINCLLDMMWIYHPQGYEVKFNDKTQIISNKKINKYCQPYVTPCYPHVMEEDLGIGRTIIPASGDNVGVSQTQVSEGCSASGACSFMVHPDTRIWTDKGLLKIKDALEANKITALKESESIKEVSAQTKDIAYCLTTVDGHELLCSKKHRMLIVENDSLVEKELKDCKEGDVILRRLGGAEFINNSIITPEFAEFLGFMHGDGCMSSKRWQMFCDDSEVEYYHSLFKKFVPTKSQTRLAHKCKTKNIYEISGNPVDYGFDVAAVSCKELYVPEIIFSASKECIARYLRGVFQADGWFNRILGLTSISKRFILDVSILLSYLGIDSTIRKNDHFEREPLKGHKVSFYVQIPKDFQRKFIEIIGFHTKNHEVSELKNRTKAHLITPSYVTDSIRALYKRDEARALGYGSMFEYGYRISDATLREHFDFIQGVCPENSVFSLVSSGQFVTDSIKSIEEAFEEVVMYDVVDSESHYCVYNTILTHNCSEGNFTGGWVEKTKCQILKEIWESKKYSAAWKYKPFSFNSNYLTDYKGMLAEFLKVYPKVTFLNMRMEELGRDLDAIKMMKLVGNNRMSAPMEGISPRIQNNMLNKCLSEVSLYNFMDDMVHMKLTDIKVGAIFTAYEEDEDFQWICDFVDKFKARAAEENGNFPFRLKATPLVHYNLTPCEYLERKSAKKSMLGEHWLTDEWYEKFREHNVFFKVNGFRYSTFIEQSLIDLGRLATPLVFKEIIQNNIGVYSLRSVATDGFVQGLKDLINPDYFFNDRDPEHYISLSHRIHIELLGSYVPRARRLVRLHQQGKLFENEPDIRCLKTYEGAKTKCQKFCIKKDPLKIYDDVEMDEEGNLHGEYEELYGCQRCNSNEERAGRLNRKIVCTKNSDDIIAVKRKPKVQKLRFVLKRNSEFEVLNPNNTAYTFITKFLQLSDNLLHEYHSMNVHSMFWESDPDEKYQVSGIQIVEVIWSNYVYDEVVSLVPEVNKMLKSTQVLSVKRIMMEEKIKLTDYNVCRFESSLPYEMFQNAIHSYKGEIKVKKDIAFEVVQDPTLKKPVIQQLGKVVGYFICPARYSPFYYLQGFLGVKKVSETKLAQSTDIQCMMVVRESKNTVCKNCGKEPGTISLTTDKNFPFGVSCLTKALMSAEVKRMKEKS